MNIVFVNSTRQWAGVKTWMTNLADFLARRNHHVSVVCRKHDALVDECRKRHIPCYPIRFGMDFSPRTMYWFWQFFTREQTEAVITNISKGFRTGGFAAKLKGLAHINRLGAAGDLQFTLKTRLLYTTLVDKVFVCSQSLVDHFSQQEYLRDKLRRFYNALDLPPLHIPRNTPLKFAIVAKLSKRKQVDKVLQVFARLQGVPWELHIGGFGEELDMLKAMVPALGLESRVHFCEGRVNPYEFLENKDVGILYSTDEGFPNGLLEYMALSCAAIASKVGGVPEILQDRCNGLLVDPYDLDSLEAAIRLLIADTELREDLIQRGYETIQQGFTRNTIFPQVEAEIQRTIEEVHQRKFRS
jgi:glycosyltransferase involved in cell wall biosynthesis